MTARWVALAAATSVVVACASSMSQSRPGAAPEAQTGAPAGSPHEQIDALSQEIDQQRAQLKLPATPHAMTPMVATGSNVPPTVACVRNPSAVCSQTCQLSDSICDNAKKICDIAKQLPADDWAAKKCSDGNETCSAAKTQCCDCAS